MFSVTYVTDVMAGHNSSNKSPVACHLQYGPGCGLKLLNGSAVPLHNLNGRPRKAVVGNFKAACAVSLEVGEAMQVGPATVQGNIHLPSIPRDTAELPLQVFRVSLSLLQATEDMRFAIVP